MVDFVPTVIHVAGLEKREKPLPIMMSKGGSVTADKRGISFHGSASESTGNINQAVAWYGRETTPSTSQIINVTGSPGFKAAVVAAAREIGIPLSQNLTKAYPEPVLPARQPGAAPQAFATPR